VLECHYQVANCVKIHIALRENEMLKQQLKKYVAAVQLLNKDGSSAHQIISDLTPALNQYVHDEESRQAMMQQHEEASQYEHKLVQVIFFDLPFAP
jgi:sorting nexin-29